MPAPESLRGRIEALLYEWEVQRSSDLQAAEDPAVPEVLREACSRAAEQAGWFIDDLDVMYSEYVKEVNA